MEIVDLILLLIDLLKQELFDADARRIAYNRCLIHVERLT